MTDEELAAAIRAVRERVEKRECSSLSPLDLMPLLHARDAAQAKVASIGTVNPRPPGVANAAVQWVKHKVARALRWHVREQVEFNRAVMSALSATLDALNDTSHSLGSLAAKASDDTQNVHTLKAIAELHSSFQTRVVNLEQQFSALLKQQHTDFQATMESMIHHELRLIRQRGSLEPITPGPLVTANLSAPAIDWLRFAEHFRGPEDKILQHQRRYAARFKDYQPVLDLGCGRGEFLDAAREAKVQASGVEANAEFAELCRTKNLVVEHADMFAYLQQQADASLGSVFCSHVIEHFEAQLLPAFLALMSAKLRDEGLVIFETPDPTSPATLANFFIDPTHTRPVPSVLLTYYLTEAGFGKVEIEPINDGLDYAAYGRKL